MKNVRWGIVFVLTLFHVGAVSALFYASWKMLLLALVMWSISGCLGICIGYHRLLTHRSFKTRREIEYFLTLCGALGLHGGADQWIRTHFEHHTDTDGITDPHSPRHGIFWSYIGWKIFTNPNRREPKYLSKSVKRLRADPIHVWLNRFFWIPSIILIIGFYYVWGVGGVLWGVCVPVVGGWHPTWLVNLVCHRWGYRWSNAKDDARNNPWLGPIAWGENWHGNHHDQQSSARHGFKWYEIDPAWYVIWAMRFVGIVWAVVLPKLR